MVSIEQSRLFRSKYTRHMFTDECLSSRAGKPDMPLPLWMRGRRIR